MRVYYFIVALFFSAFCSLFSIEPIAFSFEREPIDVVIPCTEKDLDTLDLCIEGIKKNGSDIRDVYVVSKKKLTSQAYWVPESAYPFNKEDIALELFQDHAKANAYISDRRNRLGWILQQLLKFYAPLIIENISSNVLILDSDTVFLNPVTFLGKNGAALFNPGSENHRPYFEHMKRLLPGLCRVIPRYSGISHHMLFQRSVLLDLKSAIESYHQKPLWKALLACVNPSELYASCLSEYEIYFNYALLRSKQFTPRSLKWANVSTVSNFDVYKNNGYDYVSAHAYMRRGPLVKHKNIKHKGVL